MKKWQKVLCCCMLVLALVSATVFATIYVKDEVIHSPPASAEVVAKEEFEKQIAELKEDSVIVKAELKKTQDGLQQAQIAIQTLETDKIELGQRLATKTAELETVRAENESLQEQLNSSTISPEELEEIRNQIAQNEETISQFQNSILSIEESISSVEVEIQSLSANVEQLNETLSNNTSELQSIESRIGILEDQVSSMRNGVISDMFIDSFVPTDYSTYSRSWVLFKNNLLIQWGLGRVNSKGVFKVYLDRPGTGPIASSVPSIDPKYLQPYESANYTILLTSKNTGKDTTTVWAPRVDIVNTGYFDGYVTVRTSGGNDFSNGGFYYWFTIGIAGNKVVSV